MNILQLSHIDKSFPGVKALDGISLDLKKGEILALVGENGAGKSTLIKVLGGVHQPDAGSIYFDGAAQVISNPAHAKKLGIGIIFQELNIIPGLTVQDNLFLGSEQGLGPIPNAKEKQRAVKILQSLGAELKPHQLCRELSIAQQQLVEIAKALLIDIRVLIMDEPTASLTHHDVKHLFQVVKKLSGEGISIIYVSHKLEEVEELADRIFIMRDGKHMTTRPKAEIARDEIIEIMVGRKLESEFPSHMTSAGEVALEVKDLIRKPDINGISFSLKKGEILGVAGLVGSGRTALARLIAGAERPDAGTIEVQGEVALIRSPSEAMGMGIGLIPEDRKDQGLILNQSVIENFSLINLPAYSKYGWVNERRLLSRLQEFKASMSIKFSKSSQKIKELSGGNQQKVVIAKWLERSADIFIFDEPTRGIDVGAKYEIYELMIGLITQGKSVLMISSELGELMGLSDRILVMKEGAVAGLFHDLKGIEQEDIMQLCF